MKNIHSIGVGAEQHNKALKYTFHLLTPLFKARNKMLKIESINILEGYIQKAQ